MELPSLLILVSVFIALEAFFSGSEIALISSNWIKIQNLANKGDKASESVTELLRSPDRLFTTTSLGTNLAVVSSASLVTAFMVDRFGNKGDLWATLILSPIILVLGEIIPKVACQNAADAFILTFIRPLKFFYRLFSPIVWFFTFFSNILFKKIMKLPEGPALAANREQIQKIVEPDSPTDLDLTEKKLIHRIFNFGEITVEQCMVPLVQIHAIQDSATLEEAHLIANETEFSRLPVFHHRMFNLIGILNTFDLLNEPKDKTPISSTTLIRPAYYVPPNKKIDDLLRELQHRGLHMAIVVDEFGGCIGIVTMEDLLEEIVGEIEDEFDEQDLEYENYAGGGFLIGAEAPIDAINEKLSLELPEGDFETLGGLMIDRLEKIPGPGDQVIESDYRMTVKESGKRKIQSIIVVKTNESPNGDSNNGTPKESSSN